MRCITFGAGLPFFFGATRFFLSLISWAIFAASVRSGNRQN